MKEIKDRCISKKEYLQKYDSNVGYALYVQDNIKKRRLCKIKYRRNSESNRNKRKSSK